MIRILIVDDNAVFRGLMTRLLSRHEDFTVVGEAENGEQAIAQARALDPEVVLMDFRMPGIDGFTAAVSIKQEFPRMKIFIVTAYAAALDSQTIIKNGLHGLFLKDRPAEEIIAAIRLELGVGAA
ncbi:MAG TPA: response regulator transcription factor [bacterium]